MKNQVKVVLLSLGVIIFSLVLSGCSENNPLDKVKSMFTSDAEQSGPTDDEILTAIACRGENECYCKVVQRDKQTDDGAFPVLVRMTCNDGTGGEQKYNCKKDQNEAWSCPQA